MKILILSISVLFFSQFSDCQSKTSETIVKESTEQPDFVPCYTDREVTEEISAVEMTCMYLGEGVLLEIKGENKRYSVCNSDDYTIDVDAKYIISGICYKVKPNERWPGTPFQITSLKKSE